MSAADSQDVSGSLVQYAPRSVRQPHDDGTIRPILERLSRGKYDGGDAGIAPAAVDGAERHAGRGVRWPLIAGCAVSAGATAGIALAAFAWIAPVQHEASPTQPPDLAPRQVQTVSFKPDGTPSGTAPAVVQTDRTTQQQEAAAAGNPDPRATSDAASDRPSRPAIGPKELIALWSGVPADVGAQSSASPPSEQANAKDDGAEATPPEDAKPTHQRQAHSRHSRHHHTRRHVARSHRAPAAAADAAQPQTQQAAAQPAATPLQSAWQAMFGHPVAPSGPASSTQAAFQ